MRTLRRRFGAANRPHTCIPATTVAAFFRDRPPWQRETYDKVAAHLRSLGPVIIEAVEVGIFFKRRRNFVEVRPRQKWINLSFMLNHRVDDARISRVVRASGRYYHVVRVTSASEVDADVTAWLTESYFTAD